MNKDLIHVIQYLTERDIEILRLIAANPGQTGKELKVAGRTLKHLKSWSLICSSYWWTHERGSFVNRHWMLDRRGLRMLKCLDN